jgi:hypothetical protein
MISIRVADKQRARNTRNSSATHNPGDLRVNQVVNWRVGESRIRLENK